jgi:hypothetical protein
MAIFNGRIMESLAGFEGTVWKATLEIYGKVLHGRA